MKKTALIVAVLGLAAMVVVVNITRKKTSVEPIAWYGMMPHPYKTEVRSGVERFEKETGVAVLKVVGQQWTQDNENVNVEALSTKGHKAFSIYPGDPAGANALFAQLKGRGQLVVAYGAEPGLPTPVPFTVATDIKGAAMVAAEKLIELMGGRGRILNVLELVTDINTRKRDQGITEVVARHPGVEIIQTISDMTQVSEATVKIQSALAARMDEIDGIITTGYNPTIAAASVLTEWHKDPQRKRIRFVGIDTGPTVLQAIRDGSIDATIAQNPPGHGYLSCLLLKLLLDGWTPAGEYQFINAGIVVVTRDNLETYAAEVARITDGLAAELRTKYLRPPK
ncbi:MAG: substrate-binding domain-containing protein [Candidatus Aminicenantes bacterium]|nr:substrate-binding domain-containing protein [Candidatus Aminicenantes bacterium]